VRYVQTAASEADILRYAAETVLDIIDPPTEVLLVDARRLRLGDPDHWVSLRGIRRDLQLGPPLGLTTLYLRAAHVEAVLRDGPRTRGALFARIAREHRLTVSRIEQEITASLLAASEADLLDAAPGGPALAVVRRYVSEEVGVFQIAESVHPAERFSYAVRLERERSPLR
jgi:DNA-binding GntR family transcriptional regulator